MGNIHVESSKPAITLDPNLAPPAWVGLGKPLHQILFLLVLLLSLTPALGWAAWLLAALPNENVPHKASLIGLMLDKLNQMPIWAAVAGLNMVALHLRYGARHRVPLWLNALVGLLLAAGIIINYVALGQTNLAGDQRWVEFAAAIGLLAAALLTAGQVLWMLWNRPGGIELAHLFWAAAVEWLLVFGSADIVWRLHYAGKSAVPPAARFKLFEIAALGVLVNLVFGVGLRAWPKLFGIARIRPRAWLLTLALYNVGLILLLTGVSTLCVIGSVIMLVGVILFLVGLNFLRGLSVVPPSGGAPHDAITQRRLKAGLQTPGRHSTRLALLWLMAAVIMLIVFCATDGPNPGTGYDGFGQAIEHATTAGFFGTLVIAMALLLPQIYQVGSRKPRKLAAVVAWSFGIVTLVRAVLVLATIPAVAQQWNLTMDAGDFAYRNICLGMAACAVVQCVATWALAMVVVLGSTRKRQESTL